MGKDRERQERHLLHVDKTLMKFGHGLSETGVNVYVPTANPTNVVSFLIVSDGTGVIYVDYRDGLGLRLSIPLRNIQTGKVVSTMIGKYIPDLNSYRQTPADPERIGKILPLFSEEGRTRLLMGIPFFSHSRNRFFTDWLDYYKTVSMLHDLMPIAEYERLRLFGGSDGLPDVGTTEYTTED